MFLSHTDVCLSVSLSLSLSLPPLSLPLPLSSSLSKNNEKMSLGDDFKKLSFKLVKNVDFPEHCLSFLLTARGEGGGKA